MKCVAGLGAAPPGNSPQHVTAPSAVPSPQLKVSPAVTAMNGMPIGTVVLLELVGKSLSLLHSTLSPGVNTHT